MRGVPPAWWWNRHSPVPSVPDLERAFQPQPTAQRTAPTQWCQLRVRCAAFQMRNATRSIQVLELLARRGPLGVRAIANALALPLGSTHRLLQDFDAENVVERTPDGAWELSYRLAQI